jgi:hypothetical protein
MVELLWDYDGLGDERWTLRVQEIATPEDVTLSQAFTAWEITTNNTSGQSEVTSVDVLGYQNGQWMVRQNFANGQSVTTSGTASPSGRNATSLSLLSGDLVLTRSSINGYVVGN